ncbi:MFS transporter [Streptomyces sp. SID13031]|nr:MFS transporter [Streptomyces sp. SID13031]
MSERKLGRQFGWLWTSYAVSTVGTWFAFDAFPLIAILALQAGPGQVSLLAAAGLAVGAVVAVPLGPWVEFRRKVPVMVGMDLLRFAALLSIPVAYWAGWLGFWQLVAVAVVVGAADNAFTAATGAVLKAVVPREKLLVATGRFESTTWTATMIGPPLGGASISLFGPVVTVLADAVSYLLSALSVRAIRLRETRPARREERLRVADLWDGWRYIFGHSSLRLLFFNGVLTSGLIMATAPVLAVLMLGELGFAPWQYALAFGLPCIGGLIGSRLSAPLAARFGSHRVLIVTGTLRACWLLGLAFIRPGVAGLLIVILVELGLITCMGIFMPLFAAYRLTETPDDRMARTLSAWSISSKAVIALMTALWGVLAAATTPRTAVVVAGLLILATPLLLPRRSLVAAQR